VDTGVFLYSLLVPHSCVCTQVCTHTDTIMCMHAHTQQLWKQKLSLRITLYFATSNFTTGCITNRQVSFYARVISLKYVMQTEIIYIKHKIFIFNSVFHEGLGIGNRVLNCITIPMVDIKTSAVIICTVYTVYIHLYTAHIHFDTTYSFISHTIKMWERHIHSFWNSSFLYDWGSLALYKLSLFQITGIYVM